ncbi:MAG TPA: tRNA pseudouridine(38-40) synthase TruA [Chitinispirillaceae bacterium]|nr:tRNA pseudouridine(38-40) synthase TruA [Chitinispirillaceae bacterium]
MRYFFRVEYDGTDYGGWQRQPNAISIQEKLEEAFSTVVRAPVEITGAGRTDAGVHAAAQGAHASITQEIDIKKCELSVNALLPSSIAIYNLKLVDDAFHARFSAVRRRYRYYISSTKRPLLYKRVWMVFHTVDWDLVRSNINQLSGPHDFSSFCSSGCGTENMICNICNAELTERDGLIIFTIEADRFIYKMVRSLTGTLIDIGRGYLKTDMTTLLSSKDRTRSGQTAPASGLILDYVSYPEGMC